MKKLLIFLSLTLILTGCINIGLKEEPIEYEDDLEYLAGQNIEFRCTGVGGGSIESFDITEYGCRSRSLYFNYNERIMYSVLDEPIGTGMINELTEDKTYYRFYNNREPEIYLEYKTNKGDEIWIYKKVYRLLTFLAMLDAFNQKIGEEVVYEEGILYWEELSRYYTLTLRGSGLETPYEKQPCRATKIIVTRTAENTIVVKTEEEECEADDGESINDIDEIEVTINVDEKEFMATYNDLVSQINDTE